MIPFIKGLFFDLRAKISKMEKRLQGPDIHPDVDRNFLERTIAMLAGERDKIDAIVAIGDLDIDTLASNNIVRYNTLREHAMEIELFRYLVIINYEDAEAYFKKKIRRIYDEINCLQSPPLVTTISNSENYYWALPASKVIAVPKDEEQNLLNLPDLYHEIGHLIESQYSHFLKGNIEESLTEHFNLEIDRVEDEGRPYEQKAIFRGMLNNWVEAWVMEFICDLIATYLVGPAYAWTNLKLTTVSSGRNGVFESYASHPSDESRMRAIFYMLHRLGHEAELKRIKESWQPFLDATKNSKGAHYAIAFPQQIIEQLGDNVLAGCRDIDLRCYSDQIKMHGTCVAKLLNDAWEVLFLRPDNFQEWEKTRIEELRAFFDV
jgi:hypothetical protein